MITVVNGEPPITADKITLESSKNYEHVAFNGLDTLKAIIEPENVDDRTIIWTTSDEDLATVDKNGKVRFGKTKEGNVTITATCGSASASWTYDVHKLYMESVKVYANQSAYEHDDAPLVMNPEYNKDTKDYSVDLPDYRTSLYMVCTLPQELDELGFGERNYVYFSSSYGSSGGTFLNGIAKGTAAVKKDTGLITVSFGTSACKITPNYYPTLKKLEFDGLADKAFDRDVTEYHSYVDVDAESISITPTAYKTNYTITVNGETVNNAAAYELPLTWDETGKMVANITVSSEGMSDHTYTINLEKKLQEDKPFLMKEPTEADYTIIDEATEVKPFEVIASANGELAYQWYYNTTDSNENGTLIEGATANTYTPSHAEDAIGTRYYYCVVTNTGATENNVTASSTARVAIYDDPTPTATFAFAGDELTPVENMKYEWHKGFAYDVDATDVTPLEVSATSKAPGGKYTYTWFRANSMNTPGNGTYLSEGSENSYVPGVARKDATNKGNLISCRVTYTFLGKQYTAYATTGEKNEGKDVNCVYVLVKVNEASVPKFQNEIADQTYDIGKRMSYIYANEQNADGGTLSYQWYVNDTPSTEGATALKGQTYSSFRLAQNATEDMVGTKYYYCVVTNTIQGYTASATSNIFSITVKGKEADVSNLLEGSGTLEDPYQIKDAQDYRDVYDLVKNGMTFEGKYLKQMNDITLPNPWNSIGPDASHRFSGNLDGGGHTVTVPENNPALLGYVNNAYVHDLKVFGSKITSAGLVTGVSGLNSQGYSGNAITVENVTLLSGSSTLGSGLIDSRNAGSGWANSSADYVAIVRNCTVESGVVVGYDKSQRQIGSIVGRANGVIENCTSGATVYGTKYVGGILGTRDNALGTCSITNCTFTGSVISSGEYAGGILGGGYNNDDSAPNGLRASVESCKVSGSVTGSDKVGGIIGGDQYVVQTWVGCSQSVIGNTFTGTVSATGGTAVGGIIGYYHSLNKYDNIAGNVYADGCGAQKGIGQVKYVDTNCATHETTSGAIYFNTETDTDSSPAGASKKAHNRTDDPLGADADKLCSKLGSSSDPVCTKLEASGTYKAEYTVGDQLDLTGIVLTASWSDGTTSQVALDDVKIEGFDSSKLGKQTITITYGAAMAEITINLLNKPGADIKVTVSILGDSKHGETDEPHTLAGDNLTEWVSSKEYTVNNNATVLDVLNLVFAENGISADNPSGNYIKSLTFNNITLGEMDNGGNSGWMYTLNGVRPELGVAEQFLKDNDVIVFHYTDDYTLESAIGGDPVATPDDVVKMIDAIGEVTLAKADAITKARSAYESLSAEDKAKVSNYDKLQMAGAVLNALLAGKAQIDAAYVPTGKYLVETVKSPVNGTNAGDWTVFGLARAGYPVPEGYYDQYVANVIKSVKDKDGVLHDMKYTEYSRTIIGLTSVGYDVTNVGGYNLLAPLADFDAVVWQGINGPAFALLALDSHGYDIPAAAAGKIQATRAGYVRYLLDAQDASGGWALSSGAKPGVDETAMAIQALAPYRDTGKAGSVDLADEVSQAIDDALSWLSSQQDSATGGFRYGTEGLTSESTAQVITALCALGIDPTKDTRFIKGNTDPVKALMLYSLPQGGFKHTLDGAANGMATDQAYYALAAYDRLLQGKTSLYDMSDVAIKGAWTPSVKPNIPTEPERNPGASQGTSAKPAGATLGLGTTYALPAGSQALALPAGAETDPVKAATQRLEAERTPLDQAPAQDAALWWLWLVLVAAGAGTLGFAIAKRRRSQEEEAPQQR